MKKAQLLLTGLAVAGLSLMYQAAGLQPETVGMGELERSMVGEKVTVKGEIANLSTVEGTTFFTLESDEEKVPAVMFRKGKLLLEDQKVKASGRVTIYRGKTEIIVNRIRKID